MYKKILVPVDLGDKEHGKKTLAIAEKLVDPDGEIVLFNVVEDIPSFVAAELPAGMLQDVEKNAKEDMENVAASASAKVTIGVQRGSAASAICAMAEDSGCDLIIIASHRPGLADYFLGSTAARVVRHARVPVLVDR